MAALLSIFECLVARAAMVFVLTAAVTLDGCKPGTGPLVDAKPATTPTASSTAADPFATQEYESDGVTPKRYSVVAYGYNYTDLYIDSFEVNGAGGGNLAVSTATSPGGGHTCCASLVSGLPKGTKFTIKWTRDRKRWCEQAVPLNDPVPADARYLEVHFYQDGHIEIFPSKEASPPRLKLERFDYAERHETGNVNNDEKLSTCHDGYTRFTP